MYSGGGFGTLSDFLVDDGVYATATPAQNSGQGAVFGSYQLAIPQDATIQSVKIIYERKYDVNTSIGISRVKWRVNGEEGPNHDNTDMPLTDTVVEVDVTGDRQWEPQHLTDLAFEVIAEARRGDSAVEHVQSWDYVKVEVVYQPAITIMAAYEVNDVSFSLALSPRGDHAVLRFSEGLNTATGTKFSYDGITKLLPNVKNRISFGYVGNGVDDLDIKVYVNGIEELSIEHSATQGWAGENVMDLYYGWVSTPGVSHVCRVDQIFIDDGDDLADCGNMLSTAKLPATVNDNNWNTTGGTGAVNERPLSETSFRQETRALAFAQNYTLQAASVGDVDISGETLAGYMPWAWVKRGSGTMEDSIALVANGVQVLDWTNLVLNTTPHLIKTGVVSSSYPSAAAGIGMVSNNETADTFMYECGVVVVYEGPPNPNVLFEYQQVNNETLPTIIDDNLAGVTSYEICWSVQEFDGTATMDVYIVESEGGSPQQVGTMGSSGGVGRMRIPIGIEVQVVVTVTGVTMMEIWRRINID